MLYLPNLSNLPCLVSVSSFVSFAYVEFAEKDSVEKALKLDDSTFKGRQLKVFELRCFIVIGFLVNMLSFPGSAQETQCPYGAWGWTRWPRRSTRTCLWRKR